MPAGGGFVATHRFGVPGDRLYVKETWGEHEGRVFFRADHQLAPDGIWKPAIYLAKKDARIWHEVLSVKPGRLLDVTDADARAEGFANREDFLAAWDWINAGTLTSHFDPWVWVIRFAHLKP